MKNIDQEPMEIEIAEINKLIQNFKEKFAAGTSDAENFMTMSDIENLWSNLQNRTNIVYSDMVQKLMSEIKEKDLISKKKEHTKTKE